LSPATGILDEKAERPAGEVIPFHRLEGRMAVKARMGRETLTLILDSGSNHVVLFRVPSAMATIKPVPFTIATIEGSRSVVPTRWTADMFLSERLRIGTLPAAIVQANGTQAEGLLPASAFKTIYVDHSRQELVLVR